MAQKRSFSLRSKILILLTLIPVITLGIFLTLALGVFENDKVAYVFESSSSISKSLAAQVSSELNSSLTAVKPMIQEYLLTNNFASLSQSLLDPDSPLESMAVFQWKDGNALRLAFVEKQPGMVEATYGALTDLNLLVQEANAHQRTLRVPFKDDLVLIVEKVITPTGPLFFSIFARLKQLASAFRTPGSSEVFLINANGIILFGVGGSEGTRLSDRVEIDFISRLQRQNFETETEEILAKNKEPWLASFSKVNFGDLSVVSIVPKREALKAVQILLRKSLIFFLVLICATVMVSLIASGYLTSALTDLFQATKKVTEGIFDFRVKVKSTDEIGSLASSFNAMAEEVSRLMSETAEKARMQSELKTAQTVQTTLFPVENAEVLGLNISGYYEPASECGGDWWHYSQVGDKVFLWIGDVTGHGAPAALITSAAKSAATIIERLEVNCEGALNLLNRAIYDVSKGKIMMTFFLGCYDSKTKMLFYVNASHEAPFLIKGSDGPVKKKDLIPLNDVNNPRLGQARDTEYKQASIQLGHGDRIFFYTDGIPDVQDSEEKSWGERHFIKTLLEIMNTYPYIEETVYRLREELVIYRKKAPLVDDITYFLVQVGEPTVEVQQEDAAFQVLDEDPGFEVLTEEIT
jgi:sigma-B regulation protein RsbU (phosphoserine phosphatase)